MRVKRNSYVFLGELAVLTILGVALIDPTVVGQSPSSSAATHTATIISTLKTPWGRPDLQGTWSNAAVLPFERPKEFGDRQFMTDAEHKKAVDQLLERNQRPPGETAEKPTGRTSVAQKKMSRAHTTSIGLAINRPK